MKKIRRILSAALAVLLSVCLSSYYPRNKDNVYVSGETDNKYIALTFDDGPHPEQTDRILDILKKYNVKATFFVIGENVNLYPEIVEREIEEGHEVGNHTFHHRRISKMTECQLTNAILESESAVYEICEYNTTAFRPPEGYCNDKVSKIAKKLGYNVILWKIDTYDWKGTAADIIADKVLKSIKNGDIVLMHDYISGRSNTAAALEILIPKLINEGYELVTVDELIEKSGC